MQIAADAGFARVEALVPLAAKFHRAAADARAAILTAAEAAAATVTGECDWTRQPGGPARRAAEQAGWRAVQH